MKILTFGEIMLRLTPLHSGEKLKSSNALNMHFAGSESNVSTSLAELGHDVKFVTKLPNNDIGSAANSSLSSFGIDTSSIAFTKGRIGTYFIELGTSIRPSKVIYDRENSIFSQTKIGDFDWKFLLKDVDWIFVSGISAALTKDCRNALLDLMKHASNLNVKVAFDMNYRRLLWNNKSDARSFFESAITYVNLLFGNTGVLNDLYDESFSDTELAIIETAKRFDLDEVCFTDRVHHSASQNKLQGFIYSNNSIARSNQIEVAIKDRFGTGDAFAAACIHGYTQGWSPDKTINFGNAAFALKHTIMGDQHTSSEDEILAIMNGNTSGHVIR